MTVRDFLHNAIRTLTEAHCDTPRLDAEVIIAHFLNKDRSWLYAHGDEEIAAPVHQQLAALIARRAQREPVAYITGQREFFGLSFKVTPDVLIPRPETELLVEHALQRFPRNSSAPQHIVEVGTGSGCIAISIAVHRPLAHITATDISSAALKVAQRNAYIHDVAPQIDFVQGDLLAGYNAPIDLLLSNPPYIASNEMAVLKPDVADYEPAISLTDSSNGLSIIERLLIEGCPIIRTNGALLIEIGAAQGSAVLAMAQTCCPTGTFNIEPDLAGRDRLLVGQF